MTPRLAASALHYRYADGVALADVSLAVAPGERLVLLGANAAGKTTLLFILAGLLRAQAGVVALNGRALGESADDRTAWRTAVGLLFQDPDDQLFGPRVVDDVAIGPRNRGLTPGAARDRALQVLRWLGVADLADRLIHTLSFGQRRIVAMAGVLAQAPSVLLLDEPTLGLDAVAEDDLLTTLARIRDGGVSVVMATHDVDLACRWADRAVIMQQGRVTVAGTITEVLTDERLQAARLRRPWILDAGRELMRVGLLPSGEPLPRSGGELVARLRHHGRATDSLSRLAGVR